MVFHGMVTLSTVNPFSSKRQSLDQQAELLAKAGCRKVVLAALFDFTMLFRGMLCVLILVSPLRFCEATAWETLSDEGIAADTFASYYKWAGPSTPEEVADVSLLATSFSTHSPCKALAMRDNCFSHNPKRARALLRRTHQTIHHNASLSGPDEILSRLKNQVFVFLGDSTMSASYASLVCFLSSFVEVKYEMMWLYKDDLILYDTRKQDKCPHHPSCYLLNAQVTIPSHNLTMYYQQHNVHRNREKRLLVSMVEGSSVVPTVVIVNFGAHYIHEKVFASELQTFRNDLVAVLARQRAAHIPSAQWHWLESFPQHFPNSGHRGGGYYDPGAPPPTHNTTTGELQCVPIVDEKLFHAEDWRNRVVDRILPELKLNSRVIPIAEALYSQWDAHVDYGDSQRAHKTAMDCTHYCLGSGVFRFVIDQVLGSVLACLHGACPIIL